MISGNVILNGDFNCQLFTFTVGGTVFPILLYINLAQTESTIVRLAKVKPVFHDHLIRVASRSVSQTTICTVKRVISGHSAENLLCVANISCAIILQWFCSKPPDEITYLIRTANLPKFCTVHVSKSAKPFIVGSAHGSQPFVWTIIHLK